jgi:hypothetical protein
MLLFIKILSLAFDLQSGRQLVSEGLPLDFVLTEWLS